MVDQIRVVTLKCSGCGSSLEISNDLDQFACGYCGAQLLVERRGGIVALRQMVDAVAKVQVATDKTAAELALRRLRSELWEKEALFANLDQESSQEILQSNGAAQRVGAIFFILAIVSGIVALATWHDSRGLAGSFVFAGVCCLAMMSASVRVNLKAAARAEQRREFGLSELTREIQIIKEKINVNRAIVDA